MSGVTRLGRVTLCSVVCLCSVVASFSTEIVSAQGTTFTYQGRLTDGSAPANGTYDLQFTLYDTVTGGTPQGSPNVVTNPTVAVTNGVFTVPLDFGASGFPGADRFLEIGVRPSGSVTAYTVLSPRQPLTSTPYAIRSGTATTATTATNATTATTATNATQLGGVAASQYVLTADSRLSDARPPTAGSANYIQNTTSLQSAANFNISGNGAVGGTLGIGTSTPAGKLNVVSGTADIRFGAPNGADGMEIRSGVAGHSPAIWLNHTGTSGKLFRIASYGDNTNPGSFVIRDEYAAGGLDRLTISANGRTLIGWYSASEPAAAISFNDFSADLQSSSGISAEAGLVSHSGIVNFGINSGREGPFDSVSDGFWLRADTRPGFEGFHFFKKAQTTGTESELLTIEPSGNLHPASDNTQNLGNSFLRWQNIWATNGTIQTSDARQKNDVVPLGYGLPQLLQLRPVSFRWKEGDQRTHLGFLAQEVEPIIPEVVERDNDPAAMLGMNYASLIPVLIKAVQEQQDQLQAQQRQIDALQQLVCLEHGEVTLCKGLE